MMNILKINNLNRYAKRISFLQEILVFYDELSFKNEDLIVRLNALQEKPSIINDFIFPYASLEKA